MKLTYKRKETIYSVFMLLPALVLFIALVYYPLVRSLLYSLTNWDGQSLHYQMIGFDNFKEMFRDKEILKSLYNTLYFSVVISLISIFVQVSLATLLTSNLKGSRLTQTVIYVPRVISSIIIAISWTHILQYVGALNKVLELIGLGSFVRDWLGEVGLVKNSISFVHMWQWMGYGTLIFITGINSISKDVYEAAEIDGAKGFSRFFRITLPLLMPSITINLFLSITGTLKIFDTPFAMTNGGPMNASSTVTMTILDTAFKYKRFGLSSAIGLVFFIFIAILSVTQLRITRDKEIEY